MSDTLVLRNEFEVFQLDIIMPAARLAATTVIAVRGQA